MKKHIDLNLGEIVNIHVSIMYHLHFPDSLLSIIIECLQCTIFDFDYITVQTSNSLFRTEKLPFEVFLELSR